MKTLRLSAVLMVLVLISGALAVYGLADAPQDGLRELSQKQYNNGNYKDAYEGFRKLVLDRQTNPRLVGNDLNVAVASLQQLGRLSEVDELREQVIELHGDNWRLLGSAAQSYLTTEHYGYIVAGKFERGHRRGGGEIVNSTARDRTRALQLMVQAMPLAQKDDDRGEVANYYFSLAQILLNNAGFSEAWRLQVKTDLSELPDYDPGWYYGRGDVAAPVGPDGKPVYYHLPDSWDASINDGQRWRWALSQAQEMNADKTNEVRWELATFCQSQFGVQTMAQYGYWFARGQTQDDDKDESGTFALSSLGENETIARLATGIKRFELPDEFNHIKIFQQIAADEQGSYKLQSLDSLATIFENRRQYPKAADYWRKAIQQEGRDARSYRPQRLKQIVANWCRFETAAVQPAGTGASVELRFRNGKQVHFEAHSLKVEKLLDDVKAYLKSRPAQLDWQKANIDNIGYRLVTENQTQYLGEKVASWDRQLEPRDAHFDKRITIATPLDKAGAYLLVAKMAEGNTSRIIIWNSDTAILKKPLSAGKTYYYVADAVTGRPIAKANVEFFGYRQRHIPNTRRYEIDTSNFAEFTDASGQIISAIDKEQDQYHWLITARTAEGRLAYLGFTNIWRANYYDPEYNQTKVFTITDRPVYRPKQPVKFKFWVRNARYDQQDVSDFANRTFKVEIQNPKGDKVLEKQIKADAYGGLDGEYELPEDAMLGVYQIYLVDHGGGNFRVEEYKKPEFEVTIEAPKKPIMLGEKISATIQARYYFGAPVTEAKVKYKVMRTSHWDTWYPVGDWDWFYGPGYWWYGYDYDWYPGWHKWGCLRPIAWWWPRSHQPPEIVAEAEVPIGADGKVSVEIDTALAKTMHGDQDHKYQITAEVLDQSRRTIVGSGNVLVARQPFKVFAWVDRGYYRVGDTVRASFSAHTLDQQAVQGKGKLKLLKITYDKDRQPVETPVQQWDLNTDTLGKAQQQMVASAAGQYRLSYTLTDQEKHEIEGGYLFTVMGDRFDSAQYRFNHLELIPEKREYQPGDSVKLMINTDRTEGTVLLFVRPSNGVYLPPKVVQLLGKSTVTEITVQKKDMPNFFVEAVTVTDGKVHTEAKEIVVPPEKRVLNVAVEPSEEKYKPGQAAEVKLTLTDLLGKPFIGSTVLAIYDKSVEYISGGSNVPNIKEYFWKWRRSHYPRTESSLERYFGNLLKQNEQPMNNLGVFGETAADEWGAAPEAKGRNRRADGDAGAPMAATAKAANGFGGGQPQEGMERQADSLRALRDDQGADPGAAPMVEPTVRTNFADTALWVGALQTDGDGTALVKLDMPENLTTWKIKAWAMGHGTKVGQGDVEVVTSKNLLLRMQAPRFFVQKDEVVLSANVHNYLKQAKTVQVALELDGSTLAPMGETATSVQVAADGEQRVDWRVKVLEEGEAVIRMKVLSDEESDAMEMRFPVFVHGMLKTDSVAGAIRPQYDNGKFTFTVPTERQISQSRLEVRYSPTLAGALVDALPYMVSYPYGCTEQTLNRFLPTVITQKILLEMGLDLKAIHDKRTNLNAQEIGDDRDRAKGWKRFDHNPVFSEAEVAKMVKEGIKALTDMQVSDGGWGWFSGYGEQSYPHTTAYVVHGLQIAVQNDVALVPGVLDRGVDWLRRYQLKQVTMLKNAPAKKEPYKQHADDIDAFVYMVLVDAKVTNGDMLEFLDRDRTHLSVYAKAMLGLALEKQGQKRMLADVLKNIEQYLVQDDENQSAYLRLPNEGYWWHWYGNDIEAMGYYLKLLARTDPKGEVASRLVKYLLNNRKHATYWNSTRDTSICIEAMADFLRASGEDRPDMKLEVWLDGKKQKEVQINAENLFTFDNKLVMVGDALSSGVHTVEFRKQGRGPLYYNGYITNFTLEDHITRAGLELKVNRKFYKLEAVDKKVDVAGSRGQAVSQKVEKYQRHEIPNLATLISGDLVEIELEIDSKNDYEYLIFEDMKAAGFEPVDLRSGYNSNSLGAYMELRDNRVVFFVRALARGKHSVAYRMRAEIPGKFSALPTRASAMYAPELKGNSDEIKVSIVDAE